MKIRVPPKKVNERFYLTYELKGAQKGVDVLTEYYGIPKMKIILDGRKVMKGYLCDYFEGIACFTKKGLNKRNVLHELYHHIANKKGLEFSEKKEEREASRFVKEVMRKSWWGHSRLHQCHLVRKVVFVVPGRICWQEGAHLLMDKP